MGIEEFLGRLVQNILDTNMAFSDAWHKVFRSGCIEISLLDVQGSKPYYL